MLGRRPVRTGHEGTGVRSDLSTQGAAIVVVANFHNPSILNHDFLLHNRIVDDQWGAPSDFVSTPPFATIKYPRKKVQISCQEERLQFEQSLDPTSSDISAIIDCAVGYVETLRHVKYVAVGVHIRFRWQNPAPVSWMINSFLSKNLHQANVMPSGLRLNFRYDVNPARFLTVDIAALSPKDDPAVAFATNFHCTVAGDISAVVSQIREADDLRRASEQKVRALGGGA
jgi:hypothetical protein